MTTLLLDLCVKALRPLGLKKSERSILHETQNYLVLLFILISGSLSAQTFNLSAEIRPRFEYRHGYGTLIGDNQNPATFVSQRTRLSFGFTNDKLSLYTSIQNINTWGDVSTTSNSSKNGLGIHEAWVHYQVTPKLSFRFGRQVLKYDDERIFGKVGWAQAERSHDALLTSFKPSATQQVDLGLALNANGESKFQEPYPINQYKNMQYVWYHGGFKDFELSLLALNLGNPYTADSVQKVAYSQTFGTRLTYVKNRWKTDASVYVQTGKLATTSLSAFYAAGSVRRDLTDKFSLGVGTEYLSGTDQGYTDKELHSFNPWFGTNHKFNGWMDYFYVGNFINSVGLIDVYAQLQYKPVDKWTFNLNPHFFNAAATVLGAGDGGHAMASYLGTELDFKGTYAVAKYVNIQGGYSQIFATETMQELKGGNAGSTNNWAWVMVTINPELFHWDATK